MNEIALDLKIEDEKDKLNLDETQTKVFLWIRILRRPEMWGRLPELEEMIKECAQNEWGDDTHVVFDAESECVHVKNRVDEMIITEEAVIDYVETKQKRRYK